MHDDAIVDRMLKMFDRAKGNRTNFESIFEECYEYALPMRQSFYHEVAGQRRDDKIFDETAVVGVQEFASRLQSGLVPNFARWADFIAGSEVPPEQQDTVNNELDEVTDYVFEIIQNSNFGQEIHESFMDLAVGTGSPLSASMQSLYQMCIWILALMIRSITFIENAASRSVIWLLRIQRALSAKRQ